MKNYLTIIILMCSFLAGFSQTEKGRIAIGAATTLDFSSLSTQTKIEDYESDKVKSSEFELVTEAGYFLTNNFMAGFGVIYSNSTGKENEDKANSSTFAAGPIARFYFGRQKMQPFLQTGMAFGKNVQKYDTDYVDDKYKMKLFTYEFGGGVSLFITQNLTCELGMAYGVANSSFTDHYNQDAKTTAKGIAGNFGFTVFL